VRKQKKMSKKESVVRGIIAIILFLVYTLTFLFIEERYLGGIYIDNFLKTSWIREFIYYGTTYLLYKGTLNYIVKKLEDKGLLY